ncbi:MAG: hypothetical protein Q7R35_10815 [Elusimicrobiota bacterium]|nr:hypothetical protein [Elusimicrobiota bacterium]
MGVTKKELLKLIDEAIDLEEKSIPVYRKHLDTALFWSGLPTGERRQLNIYLNVLAKESGKHFARLTALKEKIEKGEKDVY